MQSHDEAPFPDDDDAPPDVVVPISHARRKARKPRPELTELEIADRFVRRFGGLFRYCAALGGWFRWTGSHYERDVTESVRECVKAIARELGAEASALMDPEVFAAARRAMSARGLAAILDLARSDPAVVFAPADADADPWLLNCRSGTLDLRAGALRQHRQEDLITRCCPVDFDPEAVAPTFDRFLEEVQPNPEVRAYLARLFGYAAIGVVLEHILAVLWGTGANGKSVLAEAIGHVLGNYARPGPTSLIVSDGYQTHPTDVASLVGARLATIHETKRGASFDASKVKMLTGGDRLTARHMRQDFFEFRPTHTLVMLSNYRPQADATDAALWRRVQLVPFDVVVPAERRDPELTEKIRAEAPGVLRWLVDGALEWRRKGLAPPPVVLEQTERYRASEDTIGQFLEERTVRLPQASVKAGALYSAFREWCEAGGQKAVNGKDFAAEVTGRGFERVERSSGRLYRGIGLREPSHEQGAP